jgi:NADPH-dependent F420 reductase
MEITMIGAGNVGRALGTSFTRAGHSVTFVTRDPEHSREAAEAIGARSAGSLAEAVPGADVVVIAVRFPISGEDLARDLGPLVDGKIVVDVTNAPRKDISALTFDAAGSATERFAELMPGARMVKAFNTILAARMVETSVDGAPLDGFVAADDADAKAVVMELVKSIGLRPIDAGPLAAARQLEQLVWLLMSLTRQHGWDWRGGWKLVGIPDAD